MKMLKMVLAAICIVAITICATLILQKTLGRARIDLTQHRTYTLSGGTYNILTKLDQPIQLKLYYSRVAAMKGPEGIRFYNNYYLYVRDLLEEYVKLSRGKLTLEVIDPRPFSDNEEDALRFGIKKFPMSDDENFFFGLAAITELGKDKVIDFFEADRQEFVEYDLSKLVSSVTRRDKKKIGVISPLPITGSDMSPYMMQMMQMQGRKPERAWAIITHLREEYEVSKVKTDTESFDADIDFLMVVHPKELSKKTLFAIDQFVMKGGKLLVFTDPHCMADQPKQNMRNPMAMQNHKSASDLNALLANWGVEMKTGAIAADRKLAIKARLMRNGPSSALVTYLNLNDEAMNADEVVTGNLHDVQALFAGVLRKTDVKGTTVAPLIQTTKTGGTWTPSNPFELRFPDQARIARAVRPADEKVMLGCRISGKFKTNFPDGLEIEEESTDSDKTDDKDKKDKKKEKKTRKIESVKEATADAVVLVFSDVDMITDMMAYRQSFFGTSARGDNSSLVFNAFDFLGGTGDLIAIRSRGRFSRPFKVVDKIEAKAEEATARQVEAINGKITAYQDELQKLENQATEKNIKLLQSKAIKSRKELQEKIRTQKKELRRLNAAKREKIEALRADLLTNNMVWAPAIILLIAIVLAAYRGARARYYTTRRGG